MDSSPSEPTAVRLRFLGAPMGTLAYRSIDGAYALEFAPEFIATGHDLSPFMLPLATMSGARVFRTGDTPFFGGLPGLVADSLPDSWGEKMLQVQFQGRRFNTAIGKLAAIGARGPGGITYEPTIAREDPAGAWMNLREMAKEAAVIAATPAPLTPELVDKALAHGSSGLGGAQPKVSAHLPLTDSMLELSRVLVGGMPPPGHVPAIIKFSGSDGEGGGSAEFAMMRIAAAAGIRVPRAVLVFDGERRHFAVERFDRYVRQDGTVGRRHFHSLSGLLHRRAVSDGLDYSDLMRAARVMCGVPAAEEALRRVLFNVLSTNRDDHGRNHAFLYDDTTRRWDLSPAFDLNPSVYTVFIALRWMGTDIVPTKFDSVVELAELGGVSRSRAREIFTQVEGVVYSGWHVEAAAAGVPKAIADTWYKAMVAAGKELRADAQRVATRRAPRPAAGKRETKAPKEIVLAAEPEPSVSERASNYPRH